MEYKFAKILKKYNCNEVMNIWCSLWIGGKLNPSYKPSLQVCSVFWTLEQKCMNRGGDEQNAQTRGTNKNTQTGEGANTNART